uniref:RGS domain-containing protein n=2 Tax=Micrurus TaxID=8634 RepID=A0A2H6N7F7_9SAUR
MMGNEHTSRIQYPVAQPFLKSILSVQQYPYKFLLVLQINIDFQTKNSIAQSIEEATHTCFSAAQKRVYSLMENNSYPRFLESEFYQELCRKSPISRDSQET